MDNPNAVPGDGNRYRNSLDIPVVVLHPIALTHGSLGDYQSDTKQIFAHVGHRNSW
ncbi:MAG: hypothetical protein AAGG48_32000 [Planctomycetota bacterium]